MTAPKPLDFGAARRKQREADRTAAVAGAVAANEAKANRTYTKPEVDRQVWRSSSLSWFVGFLFGSALTLGVGAAIWERSSEATARQATEVFSRGVAVGQVVGDEDAGVDRPGREPRSAP